MSVALACTELHAQSTSDTLRLSLAVARAMALRANPDLAAARLDTAIARGDLRQSGIIRFNPAADVLAAAGGNGVEAGASQELELFGQRTARRGVGRARLARTTAAVANATRLTIGDVDRAFYRVAWAARRTNLADDVLALNERLSDVAQRQLTAGEISRLDLNLALVELGRARARALAARREQRVLTGEFNRLLGLSPGTPIVSVLDSTQHAPAVDTSGRMRPDVLRTVVSLRWLNVDSIVTSALARRPDLTAGNAAAREAAAAVSLVRREAFPNLILRVAMEPRANAAGNVIRPGVGMTLPFLNRNQGAVQAGRARLRQRELERAAIASRIRAEIVAAVAVYRSAAAEVEVLETTVLAPARQNRQLLEIAYREGKVGLAVLLLIRNQTSDAELEYWAAWLEEREALTALIEVTGESVIAAQPGAQ